MTRRATLRGSQRTSLAGLRADVLICDASFAGLAVARELAGAGADVLVVDRYEIGERATSACAAPTPWLTGVGVEGSIRQEIPCMAFRTPHGVARYRLPWSWSAFDYRELCRLLWRQCDARFEVAKVDGRAHGGVLTDRSPLRAPLVVDALGWRRVLGRRGYQPPEAPLSRGLEVHPMGRVPTSTPRTRARSGWRCDCRSSSRRCRRARSRSCSGRSAIRRSCGAHSAGTWSRRTRAWPREPGS